MTEMVRNMFLLAVGVVIALDDCVKGKGKFTSVDLDAAVQLTESLRSDCVVFVKDEEDVNLVRSVKTFSEKYVYHTVVNSTLLGRILERNVTQLTFFQRRTAILTKERLELTSMLKKISAPHFLSWMIFGDHTLYEPLYIPVSSEVIFINSTSERVSVTQMYHLRPGASGRVKMLRLTRSTEPRKLEKINFEKVGMKMLVLHQKDACLNVTGTLKKLECVHQEILELMGVRLNFSIDVVECLEKEHPFTYPNGSDSVLFLKLKNREVDFSAISLVVYSKNKRNYIEFVWPTFVLKSMMYLKQGRLAGRWFTYLRPLESSVWWGILIWIVGAGILTHIFEKLLLNQLKFNFGFLLDLIGSVLKALQVFCNQAIADVPESYSIRLMYLLKLFVVLIFFQAYCGYLVSSLTVVVSRFPFKDLKGFFENQQYQIMTLRKGFHQFYFRKVIGDGERENFMLPQQELPVTIQQAVDKLCREQYLAFTEFREDLLNFEKLNCKISELPSPIVRLNVGIGMPRKAPLKEFLRRELLHLKSTGLVKRLGFRLSSQTDFRDRTSDFATVSMTQIFSIFVFLGFGIAFSIVVFIIELIIERRRRCMLKFENGLRRLSKNIGSSHPLSTSGTCTSGN